MTNNNQINSASSTVFDGVYRTSKFIRSSRTNPCPVCDRTKDGDCSMSEQNNLVFCHTHQTQPIDTIINGYRYLRDADGGAGWGMFVWDDRDERGDRKGLKVRPAKEPIQYFEYPDRQGNPLIRVCRQKGGTPEFWQQYNINGIWTNASQVAEGTKRKMKLQVPLYRHKEVQEAIAAGRPILFVEGETTANALWSIGVPATTAIGGSKGLKSWGKYFEDMKRSQIWTCPDRDEEGLGYADAVQRLFGRLVKGNIKVYPSSPVWDYLPTNHGLDAADWIGEGAIAEDFLGQVSAGKRGVSTHVAGDVSSQKAQQQRNVSAVRGNPAIAAIESLTRDEVLEHLEEGRSIEQSRADSLDPYKLFPVELADLLARVARSQPCPVEALITPLLSAVSMMVGTAASFRVRGDWTEPAIFWGGIVAGTGDMKSATLKAITKMIFKMQARSEHKYKQEHEAWVKAKKEADRDRDREEDFNEPEPVKSEYYTSDFTLEAIGQLHQENPRGFGVIIDELDSMFQSLNQYRGGKGSDQQQLLSLNTGGQIKVNRLSRRIFVESTAMSITGTIQEKTLIPKLRNRSDNDSGFNARWNYCAKPFPSRLDRVDDDTAGRELHQYLFWLYESVRSAIEGGTLDKNGDLMQTEFCLDHAGQQFVTQEWEAYLEPVRKKEEAAGTGFEAVIAKQIGYGIRNAGILHIINEIAAGRQPRKVIPLETLKKGCAIAQFFLNQARSLYGVAVAQVDDDDLTPIILKLKRLSIAAIEESDGWLTTRKVCRSLHKISAEKVKSIFSLLHEHHIGELDTNGTTPRWRWTTESNSIVSSAFKTFNSADKPCDYWLSLADTSADATGSTADTLATCSTDGIGNPSAAVFSAIEEDESELECSADSLECSADTTTKTAARSVKKSKSSFAKKSIARRSPINTKKEGGKIVSPPSSTVSGQSDRDTYEVGDRVFTAREGLEDQVGEVVSKTGNNGTGLYTVELESGETFEFSFGELKPFMDSIERRWGF